jgi:hypothetical protein
VTFAVEGLTENLVSTNVLPLETVTCHALRLGRRSAAGCQHAMLYVQRLYMLTSPHNTHRDCTGQSFRSSNSPGCAQRHGCCCCLSRCCPCRGLRCCCCCWAKRCCHSSCSCCRCPASASLIFCSLILAALGFLGSCGNSLGFSLTLKPPSSDP